MLSDDEKNRLKKRLSEKGKIKIQEENSHWYF